MRNAPIPDPNTLGLYSKIDPSIPERLLASMERQESHRQYCEKYDLEQVHAHNAMMFDLEREKNTALANQEQKRLQHTYNMQKIGQIFGLIIALASLIGVFMLADRGHDGVAIALATTAMASLVGMFITGHELKKSNSMPVKTPEESDK